MLHPDIINARKKRALIYNASGSARSQLIAMGIDPQRIIDINPFNRNCFEILLSEFLTDPTIAAEFFYTMGERGQKLDKTSKFFLQQASKVARDVVIVLIRAAEDLGKKPVFGFWEIGNICLDLELLPRVLSTYPDIARKYKNLLSGSAQNEGIFGSLSELFEPIMPMANAYRQARLEGRVYHMNDFATSNHILLFGRDDERGGTALNYLNGIYIDNFIKRIIGGHADGRTKPASTYVIADEFQNLGNLKNSLVAIAAEGGRYGVALILATQSYGRIRDIYGEGDSDSLIGNMTRLISLKVGDGKTGEYMSHAFGDTTIERTTVSQPTHKGGSPTFNTITVNEPLFSPGKFLNLSKLSKVAKTPLEAICKVDGLNFKVSFPWQDLQKMLPPEASDELKAQDIAPQDRKVFFPDPLTDQDFIALGLPHLAVDPDLDDEDDVTDFE